MEAAFDGKRKAYMAKLTKVPMRKPPHTAAEDHLKVVMCRYKRARTLLTSNRPVENWGKLLGYTAAVTALLDQFLHYGHVVKFGPRSVSRSKGYSCKLYLLANPKVC